MADNRDFFNALQNEGGSPTYCEDKKLSEISAKTTVGTDGVVLKGTDGAYYEIDKASLSEVIRAELGNILADNSKNNGTSVGKVPTLNSTGNALGASSVADLATVLGVPKYQSVTAPISGTAHLFDKPSVGLMFLLRYDSRNRFGVYVYDRDNNRIETILAAPRVEVVTTPSDPTKYELYIDDTNNCISITNISEIGSMTYEFKIM